MTICSRCNDSIPEGMGDLCDVCLDKHLDNYDDYEGVPNTEAPELMPESDDAELEQVIRSSLRWSAICIGSARLLAEEIYYPKEETQ